MKALLKVLRIPAVGGIIVSLLTLGLLLAIRANKRTGKLLQRSELIVYDQFVRRRVHQDPATDSHVVICGMTEEDLIKYGHPLDDAKLAALLTKLDEAGACIVGIDLFRDLPEPRSGELYPELEKALRKLDNVIVIERLPTGGLSHIKPPPAIADQPDRIGVNNLATDDQVDYLCRRGLLFYEEGLPSPRESLGLTLTRAYLQTHNIDVQMVQQPGEPYPLLQLGKTIFPRLTSEAGVYSGLGIEGYEFLLDFRAPQTFGPAISPGTSFRTVSFGDVLENRLHPGDLQDAIVIVGVTAPSVKDSIPTPVDSALRGVLSHAITVNQLLRAALDGERPMRWWPESGRIAWIGLCTLLGGALGLLFRSPWKFGAGLAILLGAIISLGWRAFLAGLSIPVTTPAIGAFAAGAFVTSLVVYLEHSDRQVMSTLFSRHVSREVFELLWAEREQLLDGGRLKPQRIIGTVLFTDLKDYSTIAEDMDPADLMNWMNECMSSIEPLVELHGGFVNSYSGDALMAVFGGLLATGSEGEVDRHAIRAVECALAMRRDMAKLNVTWAERGLPTASMRVGIYTGPVVTGSIGSRQRIEFTTLGDTTNIAARLQALGRDLPDDERTAPCTILIGDSTWQRLRGRFTATLIGPKHLKGKAREVIVHSIVSRTASTTFI
ncbi:MAG TPA: adenylate/guanylate cyclase domain-containing protein [Chthoniobacter sp.]